MSEMRAKMFQSTPPHGGRQDQYGERLSMAEFQSTPPHGGRRTIIVDKIEPKTGFNPRPRMGGDRIKAECDQCGKRVSIHAPAWGATLFLKTLGGPNHVSIHAPAWGATTR